jgi:hypothetical protein
MLRLIPLIVLMAFLMLGSALAQEEGFGLGVIIGEPTGISCKGWTGNRSAIDFAAAWSFEKKAAVHLHGDLLWHNFGAVEAERGDINLYYGIGGRIKFEDDGKAGIRFPLGLGYIFDNAPLDFFLEVVPILDLAPKTDFSLNAAMGMRYFFGQKHKH